MTTSNRGISPINDFCARNHLGRTYVYRLIKDGKLRAVKVGSKTYIREEDEAAWRDALPAFNSAA
jgi:excisionase family DNA binding protein